MRNPVPIVLESDGSTLGEVIERVRLGRNMTLGDVQAASGISKSSLSVIERDLCDPSVTTMVRLAKALRIPLHSLLGHACGQAPTPEEE